MEQTMRFVTSRAFVAMAIVAFATAAGSPAFAKVAFGNLTSSQFIKSCRDMGGTTTHVGGGAIKCTLPSGTEVTCAFDSNGSVCTWDRDLPQTARKQLIGDPAPNSVNANTPKPPKAGDAPSAPGTAN
jgi:hypothetical protein